MNARDLNGELALVIRVMMHEPRFHGTPDWPPSPARLFQALVAAAGRGRGLDDTDAEALRWLEGLPPPTVAMPTAKLGRAMDHYVPNNDLDAKDGRPSELATIRVAKTVQPRLLEPGAPFVYAWRLPATETSEGHAKRVCAIAERIYQFGRGLDMAWALAAVMPRETLDSELSGYPGTVVHPGSGKGSTLLACPHEGSLDRLVERFEASGARFSRVGSGRKSYELFTQAPMVSFSQIEYGGRGRRFLFELQSPTAVGRLHAWPLRQAHDLVASVRDQVASKLSGALADSRPDAAARVEAAIVGRRPGDASTLAPADRVRLIPLPSIGSEHTSPSIRRMLVEVPSACGLDPEDVAWACARVELGESRTTLVAASDYGMLAHYRGRGARGATRWQTITAAALLEGARRRRIAPEAIADQRKDARERSAEEIAATSAAVDALRHAGIRERVVGVRVQREPFGKLGARAEAFGAGTRFAKERLWHVEVVLREPVRGPLVIGDGRFLGLGVMRPVPERGGVIAFSIVGGLAERADALGVAAAFRRAVLARVQDVLGRRTSLPAYVLGHEHEEGGAPLRDKPHLHFLCDLPRARLMAIAPAGTEHYWELARVREAMVGFRELRAGAAGRLAVEPVVPDPAGDPVLGRAHHWRSVTPYTVNRHRDAGGLDRAVIADVVDACASSGLPAPVEVTVREVKTRRGQPVSASVDLRFAVAVAGPILIGRTRFRGGGVFERSTERSGE